MGKNIFTITLDDEERTLRLLEQRRDLVLKNVDDSKRAIYAITQHMDELNISYRFSSKLKGVLGVGLIGAGLAVIPVSAPIAIISALGVGSASLGQAGYRKVAKRDAVYKISQLPMSKKIKFTYTGI